MHKPVTMPSVDEIRARLAPLFTDEGLQLVLLFGSVASGKTHKRSDIDLAFLFDEPHDVLELTNMVTRRLHVDNVDVIDLRRASPLLKMSVVKTGRLLYERTPALYNTFCSLSFRMYADCKKLRDAQMLAVKGFIDGRVGL